MSNFNYSRYLQIDRLLSLQQTQTPRSADHGVVTAEHFFMVAHQSSELWLKQVIMDVRATTSALQPLRGEHFPELALEHLHRATDVLRLLQGNLACLELLPLRHFAEFRTYLGTASGAQSIQFHALDRLLDSSGSSCRLYDAYSAAVHYEGMTVHEVCALGVEAGVLHRLAEELVDLGNAFWRWKVSHIALLSKMIGEQPGTAGTSGAEYLAKRAVLPFPELRRLRGDVLAHEEPHLDTA